MIKIENNEVVFDDGKIKLVQLCGVYVIFKELVFSLNNGAYMIERCHDEEDAVNKWDYVCRKLKSNPNFLQVEGMNVMVNVSQLHTLERTYDENDKSYGVKLNYSNQEIGIWDRSKPLIDKCYNDLKNEMIQLGINKEKIGEKEQ